MEQVSRKWLTENVPWEFWTLWFNHLVTIGGDERWLAFRDNCPECTHNTTFRKWLSWYGAVRPPLPEIRKLFCDPGQAYICEFTSIPYLDCGNRIYKMVLTTLWPEAKEELQLTNEGTIGDLLEALFGYVWLTTQGSPMKLGPSVADFIELLERYCFITWAKQGQWRP